MSKYVRSAGLIMLTAENRSTQRKTCLSAPLYITNPTQIGLGLNPGLRRDRPSPYATFRSTYDYYVIYWAICSF
jgi:hypothetical protein